MCLRPEVIASDSDYDLDETDHAPSIDFNETVVFSAERPADVPATRPATAALQLRCLLVQSVVKATVQHVCVSSLCVHFYLAAHRAH